MSTPQERVQERSSGRTESAGIRTTIPAVWEAVEAEEVQINPTTGLRLPAPTPTTRRAAEPTDMRVSGGAHPGGSAAVRDGVLCRSPSWRASCPPLGGRDLRAGDGAFAGWIHLERGWDDVEGAIAPKFASSRRRVPIVRPYLSDVLEELHERSGRNGTELVFGRTANVPFEPAQVLRRVAKTLEDANAEREEAEQEPLERFGLHDGRHTFGAMCRADRPGDDLRVPRTRTLDGDRRLHEAEMTALENMGKLVAYLARG